MPGLESFHLVSPGEWLQHAIDAGKHPLEAGALDLVLVALVLIASSMLVDPLSGRYLIPAWHLAHVGLVVATADLAPRRWIVALLAVAFPLGGLLNALDIARAHSPEDVAGFPHSPPLDGLIEALHGSGLKRGFAMHRYANAATVRSGGEVVVCDARFGPEPEPMRWLNEHACIAPRPTTTVSSSCSDPAKATPRAMP